MREREGERTINLYAASPVALALPIFSFVPKKAHPSSNKIISLREWPTNWQSVRVAEERDSALTVVMVYIVSTTLANPEFLQYPARHRSIELSLCSTFSFSRSF